MLILTGNLNGTNYDNEIVPAKVLADALNVPPMGRKGKGHYAEFRQSAKHTGKAKRPGGEENNAQAFHLAAVYNLTLPTGTLSIRYTVNRTSDRQGNYSYDVLRVHDFTGKMLALAGESKFEKFVWFWLHPGNATNPYRNQRKPAMFMHYDREAEAVRKQANTAMTLEVINEINMMEVTTLRILAQGLRYRVGQQEYIVPNAAEAGEQELRSAMTEMAMTHREAFVEGFRSGGANLVGQLRHAEASQIIVLRVEPHASYWMWAQGPHKGSMIVSVQRGANAHAALQAAFSTNADHLLPILNAEVQDAQIRAIGDRQEVRLQDNVETTGEYIQTLTPGQLLENCMVRDIVAFDRATNGVFFINEVGEFEGDPVFMATALPTWKAEFLAALPESRFSEVREVMAERLTQSMATVQAVPTTPAASSQPFAKPKPQQKPGSTSPAKISGKAFVPAKKN